MYRVDDKKIMELIKSVSAQEYAADEGKCNYCCVYHGEDPPDKRTTDLAIQLASVLYTACGTSEFALDEDVYDTLTKFLVDFGGD